MFLGSNKAKSLSKANGKYIQQEYLSIDFLLFLGALTLLLQVVRNFMLNHCKNHNLEEASF